MQTTPLELTFYHHLKIKYIALAGVAQLACKPKVPRFDSQSGHIPGLWARCPVGGIREATTH